MTDADTHRPTASSDVIATLPISQGRRVMGTGAIGVLGLVLLWLGLQIPLGRSLWGVGMVIAGAGVIALAVAFWRATDTHIVLTRTALSDARGRVIARVADIRRVDRGAFVPKPSQGFLLKLDRAAAREGGDRPGGADGRAWVPGVWWRVGRHAGIGGVTAARQAKDMSALIDILIAERDRGSPFHGEGDGPRSAQGTGD